MGVENTILEDDGESRVGLTYMTGTHVKLGQCLAGMLVGGDRTAWFSYLVLWLGLVAGAVAGASIYPALGFKTLWIATAAAPIFAVIAFRLERASR